MIFTGSSLEAFIRIWVDAKKQPWLPLHYLYTGPEYPVSRKSPFEEVIADNAGGCADGVWYSQYWLVLSMGD
jgi:hypothetical protein